MDGQLDAIAVPRPAGIALDADDDNAFAATATAIEAYLLSAFPGLRGLAQRHPHFDPARDRTTDPLEHTLEVLAALDTRGLLRADAMIVRAAAIFHDVGKVRDPLNVRHALDSVELCPPYLATFPLTTTQRDDVVSVVLNHDTLGRLATEQIDAQAAATLFGTRRIATLTERLTRADVGSIRGLVHVLPNIAAAYAEAIAAFDALDHTPG